MSHGGSWWLHGLCLSCRYGYIDFLKYAWSAQMINQFETSHTRVLEGLTVSSSPSCIPCSKSWRINADVS